MRRELIHLATVAILIVLAATAAVGQVSTGFTYQGQLRDGGVGIDAASARMIFRLWDAETGGAQIGTDNVAYPVVVTQGIFTVVVDFGGSAFQGSTRWLQIGVDTSGGDQYIWLSPRQKMTAAPMALYAPPWLLDSGSAGGIYYHGPVGIGIESARFPLDVQTSTESRAVSGTSLGTTGTNDGVYGTSVSSDGRGVHGYAGHPSGAARGVFGQARSPVGFGVYGYNSSSSGNAVGIYGETNSPSGFAGYFSGRGYFSGQVGIGVPDPTTPLDVAGTIQATGLKISSSPQTGYVLTSDAQGNGTWQAPTGAGGLGGSGTDNYLPKFTASTTLGNSVIYETAGGNIGIGTPAPSQKLHVLGTIRSNGFQLPINPQSGHVLTSDASGNATWQAPTGESLWAACTGGIYFNSGTVGIGTTSPNTSDGLHVVATGVRGVHAEGASYGVYGEGTTAGVSGQSANTGVRGTGSSCGVQGYCSTNGSGIKGESVTGIGVHAIGGGTGTTASALYAANTNSNGIAITASTTSTDANVVLVNKGTGDILKGFSGSTGGDLVFEVENNGRTSVTVLRITGGADLSEQFDVRPEKAAIRPGTVVCIDPLHPGKLMASTSSYDRTVAGVISGAGGIAPGMMMGQRGSVADGNHPVALTGRVYVWADASHGAIAPGDLLTTSDTPGHAMRVADHEKANGAVLGKAMTTLSEGRGLVLALVSLQ